MAEGASLGGETIATALTTTTLKETPEITFISELHHQIPLSIIHNTVLRPSKQLTNMQLPTRGGHGRGWSRPRGRGRVTMQPTQSSENTSDSDPRNKQHDDNEVGRQQSAVEDEVETQKTPVCGQVDDRCAEAVLWSQSRTELNTYCDEDANEYVVRPRVCLPGPNLNGNDEKLGRNHKIEQHCILIGLETLTDGILELKPPTSVEYVDASKDRARASSSSSSTGFSEEFFDAVEYQPASAPPESSNTISPPATLYSPLNASVPEFIPKPPTAPVAKEWQIEPSFFASSKSSSCSSFLPHTQAQYIEIPETAGIKNEINKAKRSI